MAKITRRNRFRANGAAGRREHSLNVALTEHSWILQMPISKVRQSEIKGRKVRVDNDFYHRSIN